MSPTIADRALRSVRSRVIGNTRLFDDPGDVERRYPAQTALAWLLSRGEDVAPIPGTRRVARVEENTAADDITRTADRLQPVDQP